jgi:hypothetical protein
MRLSQDLVLRYLTGARDGKDPQAQAQALATVLHESYHSRVEFDAPAEPNAIRKPQSLGLDEGLTELQTVADFDEFAERAGYDGLVLETPEYAGAIEAAGELLSYAATSEAERALLAASALDAPVMMRWDVVADEIVRTRLGDVVPHDSQHQQADVQPRPDHAPGSHRQGSRLTQRDVQRRRSGATESPSLHSRRDERCSCSPGRTTVGGRANREGRQAVGTHPSCLVDTLRGRDTLVGHGV